MTTVIHEPVLASTYNFMSLKYAQHLYVLQFEYDHVYMHIDNRYIMTVSSKSHYINNIVPMYINY